MLLSKKWFSVLCFAGGLALAFVMPQVANAAPIPAGGLAVSATIVTPDIGSGSPYNPRAAADGNNYFVDISAPYELARIPAGSETVTTGPEGTIQHRMAMPFQGANATNYILATGGDTNDNFTRYDYADFANPATAVYTNAAGHTDTEPNSFGWVDDDTIIFGSYEKTSGVGGVNGRLTLNMADVVAEPFSVTKNTTWNANGAILAASSGRIRNPSVGDTYSNYAYYGEAGVANGKFYALQLDAANPTPQLLGTLAGLTSDRSGSWGLWTVKEVDGYLYVHTSENGIHVYDMTNATTLGTEVAHHTQEQLDAISGWTSTASWGFDVVDNGERMLYTVGTSRVVEIIQNVPGDANRDAKVDVSDLGILATNYTLSGMTWADGDFTGDTIVNVSDLGILATYYGTGTAAGAAVPEPATLSMLLMAMLTLCLYRSSHHDTRK